MALSSFAAGSSRRLDGAVVTRREVNVERGYDIPFTQVGTAIWARRDAAGGAGGGPRRGRRGGRWPAGGRALCAGGAAPPRAARPARGPAGRPPPTAPRPARAGGWA